METLGVSVLVLGGIALFVVVASMVLGTGRQRDHARRAALRSHQRELQRRGA
jgi:hypothetical protein